MSISRDGSVIKQLYCTTAVSALQPHQVATECIITKSIAEGKIDIYSAGYVK